MNAIDSKLEKNVDLLRTNKSKFISIDDAIYLPPDQELEELTKTPIEILKKYDNWYFIDGKCYYVKELKSILAVLNELLGEHLSEYMKLPTIKYDIAEYNNHIYGLVSENFKSSQLIYKNSFGLSKNMLRKISRIFHDSNFAYDEKVRRDLTAYIIRNYYSAQKDRMANSMYAFNSEHEFLIAPLHDYESSFQDTEMFEYMDPILSCTFTQYSCEELRHNNPYFQEYVNMILDYSIELALKDIENRHLILIPEELKDYYKKFDLERKNFIKAHGLYKK